ncbi:MAG TPA: hypothetical protein VMJ32_03190 [Pirellulales bacterium]|nr:hypothetical protein [Pirellulales bacterium]
MRKLLIFSILSILPAFGCADGIETMRRIEVWKAQTFFTPTQPVVMAPAGSNPCGAPVAATPGCNCQQGAAAQAIAVPAAAAATQIGSSAVNGVPGTVSAGYPAESSETDVPMPGTVTVGPERPAETVSTEELNGVLKQP